MTYLEPALPMVSAHSRWALTTSIASPTSSTWASANTGYYYPIIIPTTCVARRLWWANGSSVSASYTLEAAIYQSTPSGDPGVKLVSTGSTAQGTALQVQLVDITDTVLPPGLYYLLLACSSTSATVMRSTASHVRWNELLVLSESITPGSAPSTASASEDASLVVIYLFGFATTASP